MAEKMNVLLVEDEVILLQGLKKLVGWEGLGFTICATATSYREAVSAAYLFKPDLIIADIMLGDDQKTGLDLVEYLGKLLPEMQSVILTGYDRFEYAERAITYSVKAYLLKPVSSEELTECLNKIRATFEQRRADMRRRQEIDQYLKTARHFLFDWFLNCAEDKVWERFFGLTGREFVWQVVVLSFSGKTVESDLYQTFMELNRLKENQQPDTLSFLRWTQMIYVLRSEQSTLGGRASELVQLISRYCDFNGLEDYVVGVGQAICRYEDLQLSYDEAVSACRHVAFFNCGKCIYYADIALPKAKQVIGFAPQKEKLQFAVCTGHADEAGKILRSTLVELGRQGTSIETLRSLGMEAMVILNEVSQQNSLPALAGTAWQQIALCSSLDDLCSLLEDSYADIGKKIDSCRTDRNHALLEQVRHTIDTDFAKKLTLDSLARLVYLSPPYLSHLFFKEFGISIHDYLTEVRVEAAKKLLVSGSKVYEAAERVGYTDSRYFSQIFRKYAGLTPLEFRAQNCEEIHN